MPIALVQHITLPTEIPLTDRQLMREIGLMAREAILRRTAQGLDSSGNAFTPYSPRYAEQKAKALGAGPVNLQASGAMLNALSIVDVGEDFVVLGFS